MSVTREIGDDHGSHEEVIEIKALLKMLVDSQAKQAESQTKLAESHSKLAEAQAKQAEFQNKQAESFARLAETQANTHQQIIEILKSTNYAANNHQKQQERNSENVDKGSEANGAKQKQPKLDRGLQACYVPGSNDLLCKALKGNELEKANEYIRNNPEVINQGIAHDSSTTLHMALYWKLDMTFVEDIVKLMTPVALEYKKTNGNTALHIAVRRGTTEAVVMLVDRNPNLTQIRNNNRETPLELALRYVTVGQKEIVEYLYSVTRDVEPSPFAGHDGARLLCKAIDANFYDIALCLVKKFPKLITEKSLVHEMCGLELLVRKPSAFQSGTKLTWWQDHIYSLIKVDNSTYVKQDEPHTCESSDCTKGDEENPSEISEIKKSEESSKVSLTSDKRILMRYLTRVPCIIRLRNQMLVHEHAVVLLKQMVVEIRHSNTYNEIRLFFRNNPNIMKVAIENGIMEFVVECLERFDDIIWLRISGQRMIEMAISERNLRVMSFIYNRGYSYEDKISLVSTTDYEHNTILHYAAKLAPAAKLHKVSGVALQMQRELQWFKGVESMMPENDKFKKNRKGYTAQSIFTEEHKQLVKEGEAWMKDTSGSCMVVTALIATVAFAAAFTVPGGNISDSNSSMNGSPVFLGRTSFTLFVVADALALFASITSVLVFLAIYTSRYAEIDFLESLPQKLIIGLATLFISMAAIMFVILHISRNYVFLVGMMAAKPKVALSNYLFYRSSRNSDMMDLDIERSVMGRVGGREDAELEEGSSSDMEFDGS
ncbi:hypothetical protein MKW98_010105 [Papaver atlanticum]|uniref:PGG domain-containing protein n=1 Tax=Papaver atlanticum TaxID=357466 RepID=A0AAD4RY05_9MAGN|nr:hypothetical protein MKW98_010105 [Papaver atlanticum]